MKKLPEMFLIKNCILIFLKTRCPAVGGTIIDYAPQKENCSPDNFSVHDMKIPTLVIMLVLAFLAALALIMLVLGPSS